MPFAKRAVSPVRISCKPVSEENKFDLPVVCNNTLVGALQQLASLTFHADELFSELNQECLAVVRRTRKLIEKSDHVKEKVESLDFRTVKIPAGDLKTYREVTDHYKSEYGLDALLFNPATRPDCIIDLYEASALSPVKAIRQCNAFRKDGRTGSKLFSLTPVVKDDALYGVESVIDIAQPLHYGDFERKPREPKSVKRRPRSLATLTELDNNVHRAEEGDLPPMEGGDRPSEMSASADLVPIDITGSGFARMAEYRESMRSTSREYLEDETNYGTRRRRHKHNRRQTVSGGLPEHASRDYGHGFTAQSQMDLRVRSVSREKLERPKSMAYLDRYAPKRRNNTHQKSREELRKDRDKEEPGLARSCSLRRSMKSLFRGGDREKSKSTDLWVEGRPRSPGPPMVEIDFPLRRSKSLPRSLKNISKSLSKLIHSRSASTEGRLDSKQSDEAKTKKDQFFDQGYVTVVTNQRKKKGFRKSLTQRMSRSQSHMSALATSSSNVNSKLPPKSPQYGARPKRMDRPKSLEFGAIPTTSGRHSIPVCTPTTPSSDGVFTPGSESGALGMKHRLNIPPGQAWKAFGGIRYRGGSAGQNGQQERQSSSEEQKVEDPTKGNWSATDGSTRYSTESSEYPQSSSSQERTSQVSGGDRDSAVSFNMYGQDRHNTTTDNNPEDDTSTINSDISTVIDDASTIHDDEDSDNSTLNGSVVNMETNTKETSETWLNSLSRTKDTKEMKDKRRKRRSRKDRDGRNKSLLDSPSGLTMNNVRAHDVAQCSNIRTRRRTGDEESSIYSQDTDGFYTSMHIDSGLKNSLLLDNSNNSGLVPVSSLFNGTSASYFPPHTLHGVTVPITLHSSSRNGATNGKITNGSKKIPPPPPRRTATLSDKDKRFSSPPSSIGHEDELDRLLAASSFSLNSNKSSHSNDSKSRLSQTFSETNLVTGINESVVSESDTEVIYTRVKNKTNISTAGYPSLCSVTPLNSEDEDTEMLGFSSEWRSSFNNGSSSMNNSTVIEDKTLDSSNHYKPLLLKSSTPIVGNWVATGNKTSSDRNSFQGYKFNPILEVSRESSGAERSLDESGLSLEMDISGMDLIDTSVYSTWPRNPKNAAANNNDDQAQYNNTDPQSDNSNKPPGALPATYVRALKLFNVGSLEELPNTRDALPEVKTPDKMLDADIRVISHFSDTFCIPTDQKFTFDSSDICPLNVSDEQKTPVKVPDFVKTKSPSKVQFGEPVVVKKPPKGKKLDMDSASDYQTGTWPRKRGNVTSPKFIDDSCIATPKSPTLNMYELDEKSWTNSFPRKKDKKHFSTRRAAIPRSLDLNQSVDLHDVAFDLNKSYDNSANFGKSPDYSLPVAAQAQLIISSPVANKAEYVDNPHKRSMCSPVSSRDFVAFSQFNLNSLNAQKVPAVVGNVNTMDTFGQPTQVVKSSTMFDFPTDSLQQNEPDLVANSSGSAFKPVSKPLFPSISAMKHSLSFPETTRKSATDPSTYNRTWYDSGNPYASPDKKSLMISPDSAKNFPVNKDRLSQTGYPFAAFLDDSFLSTLESGYDSKRQSVISTNSTNSSGSGKKSVTFASDLKTSQSSLNKSETASVGSNHTENSNTSRSGLAGILTSFRRKSIESLKSIDSAKSSKSSDSVKLRNGKTVEVTIPQNLSKRSTLSLKSALSKKSSEASLTPSIPSPDKWSLASPDKMQVTSPLKLKRSSALLDDDFDLENYAFDKPTENSNPNVKAAYQHEKTSRSSVTQEMPTDVVQHHAKRHCTTMVPRPKSTGKVIMAKKTKLRKAPSKSNVTVVVNADSCEVVNMPPVVKADMKENKDNSSENPFSSIIMESAPSKMTVTSPFDFSAGANMKRQSFGFEAETSKPVVISARPARTSKIITSNKNVKSTGAVVNLLHSDPSALNGTNIKYNSLPRKSATISDILVNAVVTPKTVDKVGDNRKTFTSFAALQNDNSTVESSSNKGLGGGNSASVTNINSTLVEGNQKDNAKTSAINPTVVKINQRTKIPVPAKFNNDSKISVINNSNISSVSNAETNSSKSASKTSVLSDKRSNNADSNPKSSKLTIKADVKDSTVGAKEQSNTVITKSPSAFNEVLSDSTNKIKPTPPKFVLPKLNTLQTTNDKKKTSDTSKSSNSDTVRADNATSSNDFKKSNNRNENTSDTKVLSDSSSGNSSTLSKTSTESKKSAIETSPVVLTKPPLNRSISNGPRQPVTSQLKTKLSLTNSSSHVNNTDSNDRSKLGSSSAYPYTGSTTSLHQTANNNSSNLGQTNVLTKSLSNLSCLSLLRTESSFSLSQSNFSLAKSTDSLASTSSINAEKSRNAKLAFLEQQNKEISKSQTSLDNRFAKYSLGLKKLSESRTSLTSSKSNLISENAKDKNSNLDKQMDKNSSESASDKISDSGSNRVVLVNGNGTDKNWDEKSPTTKSEKSDLQNCSKVVSVSNENKTNLSDSSKKSNLNVQSPTSSPGQGKFVSSLIGKFQK